VDAVVFEGATKIYRHRPVLHNWFGVERAGQTVALREISLAVPAGDVLVILGPNGSGKTTLLKLVSAMLLPDFGRVVVHGADTVRQPQAARRCVGFAMATERSFFPRLTAAENLQFFAAFEDVPRESRRERICWALEATGLSNEADTLAMKFSSGMYQKLGIARALLKRPSILLVDEPSRSLDPGAARHLWEWLRQSVARYSTVLLTTHNFEEAAATADSVVLLRQGTLVAQSKIVDLRSLEELRRFYFAAMEGVTEMATTARGA